MVTLIFHGGSCGYVWVGLSEDIRGHVRHSQMLHCKLIRANMVNSRPVYLRLCVIFSIQNVQSINLDPRKQIYPLSSNHFCTLSEQKVHVMYDCYILCLQITKSNIKPQVKRADVQGFVCKCLGNYSITLYHHWVYALKMNARMITISLWFVCWEKKYRNTSPNFTIHEFESMLLGDAGLVSVRTFCILNANFEFCGLLILMGLQECNKFSTTKCCIQIKHSLLKSTYDSIHQFRHKWL